MTMGLKNSEEKATPKLHVQYAWFQNSHAPFLKNLLEDVIHHSETSNHNQRKKRDTAEGCNTEVMTANQEHSLKGSKQDRCAPDIESNSRDWSNVILATFVSHLL